MKHQRRNAGIAALATVLIPAAGFLQAAPTSHAVTALFAEGATRQGGEAQSAFGGVFCEQNECRSLGRGTVTRKITSQQIQAAVDSTPGDLILAGYSVGGAGMYDRLREWERNPSLAPDPDRIVLIVTFGNPENKFGGQNRNNVGVGLPAYQPYDHLDVVAQYDGVADNPTRFGFYSYINSAFSRHFSYFDGLDINDPDNLVYQEGNTTYMLIPAETLPMLQWVRPFVSAERMAELDAKYRPLVERDYDRPAYVPQGEGADWGNGNPPPSLAPVEEPVDALTVASADSTDAGTSVGGDSAAARTSSSRVADAEANTEVTDDAALDAALNDAALDDASTDPSLDASTGSTDTADNAASTENDTETAQDSSQETSDPAPDAGDGADSDAAA